MRVILFACLLLLAACSSAAPSTAITPQDVLAAFAAAGLEAESPTVFASVEDWGPLPMGEAGLRFLIPSLCDDCGGRIFLFKDSDQADRAMEYYESLGEESALLFTWAFRQGNLVVQINGDLPEEEARRYEEVLNGLGQ